MERTLIKQGGGGYTIYLPKKWVDRKALKEGTKVDVRETDTALIISSIAAQKRATTVTLTEENRKDLTSILTHLYRTGFDSITVRGTDTHTQQEITHAVQLLIGFEVTQREKHAVKIEAIMEPGEQKYDTLLRRAFLIIKETHAMLRDSLLSGEYSDVGSLRTQHDKLVLYCRRILAKEQEEKNLTAQWELLTFLMHIEHGYSYLYEYSKQERIRATKRTQELLQKLSDYFELFHNAYFTKDMKLVHKINRLKREYQFGRCYEQLLKAKGPEVIVVAHIRELFRLIQIGTSPILSELVLAQD